MRTGFNWLFRLERIKKRKDDYLFRLKIVQGQKVNKGTENILDFVSCLMLVALGGGKLTNLWSLMLIMFLKRSYDEICPTLHRGCRYMTFPVRYYILGLGR